MMTPLLQHHEQMAELVRIVGRGPGRSRSLTREEAQTAFTLILLGDADPHQIGALLMLMRYRGESPVELAGFVDAARRALAAGLPAAADDGAALRPRLDWPSYSGGRTRDGPWFLLSALALARAGYSVVMHGAHEFSTALSPAGALPALGLRPADSVLDAYRLLAQTGFAYLPLRVLLPSLDNLLQLRHLFGLRSPVNTVVRLLNPLNATASIDGVFHPPYIDAHLGTAALLGCERLLVMKGAGGEAERNPAKPCVAGLWSLQDSLEDPAAGRKEHIFPARTERAEERRPVQPQEIADIWRSGSGWSGPAGIVIGTIALALLALGAAGDVVLAETMAEVIWNERGAQQTLATPPFLAVHR